MAPLGIDHALENVQTHLEFGMGSPLFPLPALRYGIDTSAHSARVAPLLLGVAAWLCSLWWPQLTID